MEVKLTKKQALIVKYILQGYPNRNIADMLGVEECTIKNHLTEIYKLENVTGRSTLIIKHLSKNSEKSL